MKTPKKVIEKISLPLMFVTFVMAVLMFVVSPLSAQGGVCDAGNFCDRDSDGAIRVHKKCEAAECGVPTDDDDNDCLVPDGTGQSCDLVINDGDIYPVYSVQLTGGPFQFGTDPDPLVYVTMNSKGNLNSYDGEPLYIQRPPEGDAQDAWDLVFDTCVRDFSTKTNSIPPVLPNDWGIGSNSESDIHIDLKNIMVEEVDSGALQRKEIQIHLRGTPDDPLDQFPPACDNVGDQVSFDLRTYKVWGKPWTGPGRSWDTCFLSENGDVYPGEDPNVRFYSTLTITCDIP
jgi:hypothetical protein